MSRSGESAESEKPVGTDPPKCGYCGEYIALEKQPCPARGDGGCCVP